jgi:hypothetical protein
MKSYMGQFQFQYINKSDEEYEIDKIVTKKIMIHLQTFFKQNNDDGSKNTRKGQSKIYKNKTLRHK